MHWLVLAAFLQAVTTVTATWNANAATDNVTTYRVSYGVESGKYIFTPVDVPAPTLTTKIGGLVPGTTYYFVVQAINTFGISPVSAEVSFAVPQVCTDSSGNNVVQLRVLGFTSSLATGGLGQLMWTITSVNRIVNITASLNAMAVSTIDGSDSKTLDLARSAGVNFNAPSTKGSYSLVVSATDSTGCKADTSSVNRIVNVF